MSTLEYTKLITTLGNIEHKLNIALSLIAEFKSTTTQTPVTQTPVSKQLEAQLCSSCKINKVGIKFIKPGAKCYHCWMAERNLKPTETKPCLL